MSNATNNGDLTVSRVRDRHIARWPVILIGLLVVQASGILWMVTIAGSDPSFAVEPHYYEKAVAWDQAARQEGVNRALAWKANASISAAGAQSRRTLRVALSDRLGRPLEGASVAAEVFHQARAGERMRIECSPKEPGIYAGAAALSRVGVYEVRLTIARGPDVFTQVLSVDAPLGAAP